MDIDQNKDECRLLHGLQHQPSKLKIEPLTVPAPTVPATKTEKADNKGGLVGFTRETEARHGGKEDVKEETTEAKAAEAVTENPHAAASAELAKPSITHHAVTTDPSSTISVPTVPVTLSLTPISRTTEPSKPQPQPTWPLPIIHQILIQVSSSNILLGLLISYMQRSKASRAATLETCRTEAKILYDHFLARCDRQAATTLRGGGVDGLAWMEVVMVVVFALIWQRATDFLQTWLLARKSVKKNAGQRINVMTASGTTTSAA